MPLNLNYVDEGPKWHEKKSGTPTMGGVVFMLAGVISTLWVLIWQKDLNKTAWILIIAFLGYGIIGFLDDGIKLYFKRNLGLNRTFISNNLSFMLHSHEANKQR